MKKLYVWLPFALVLLGLTSCLGEEDNLNGPYRSWVTVFKNDAKLTLKTDRGLFLDVVRPLGDSSWYEVGDRANVLYTMVDVAHTSGNTYEVVMNEYNQAVVKPFVFDSTATYRNKPLAYFSAAMVSENYLNVLVKTFDSNDPVNTLELVRYTAEERHLDTDSFPVIRVRLQHNVGTVKNTSSLQAFCFDLTRLQTEFPNKKGYTLRFSWKSADDEQEYNLRYIPSDN